MYQVKGFFRTGVSAASFDDEDVARHAYGRVLTRYSARDGELTRCELWDDDVLLAVYSCHGLDVKLGQTDSLFHKAAFPWLFRRGADA